MKIRSLLFDFSDFNLINLNSTDGLSNNVFLFKSELALADNGMAFMPHTDMEHHSVVAADPSDH